MRASRQIARVFIASMVLLSLFTALAPAASAQNPVPALSINIDPTERTAQITSSQPGVASFDGNWNLSKVNFERAVVTILGSVSTGWPVTISPATFVVTNQRTGRFGVTVVVPPGELATNIGQMTLTGRATAGGLQSTPSIAQAIISPSAYFRVVAATDTPFLEVSPSSQAAVLLKIYNEGNVRDTIKIQVKNLEELTQLQWVVVMTRQSFIIGPPPEFQPVQIQISLPKGFNLFANQVNNVLISASSLEGALAGQTYEDTIPVFIRLYGFSLPGFDVPLVMMGAILAALVAARTRQQARLPPSSL